MSDEVRSGFRVFLHFSLSGRLLDMTAILLTWLLNLIKIITNYLFNTLLIWRFSDAL